MSIPLTWLISSLSVVVVALLTRAIYLFNNILVGRKNVPSVKNKKKHIKTMVVAGSGGHTGEMMRVVSALREEYNPRLYLVAQTDKMSEAKIQATEEQKQSNNEHYKIYLIPRSREVRQSWSSSILSTLYSCLYTFPLVWKQRPDLLLVNGPGTCIPVCVAAFILTFFCVKKVRIIYIESLCRVKTMSLSGKLLYYFADQFVVQWPDLHEQYKYATYMGRVV